MVLKEHLTGFRALTYRSGHIYNWVNKRLYDMNKKFVTIAKLVGHGNGNGTKLNVLDLPCGTGYLARFLHQSVNYEGWDLNEHFLHKLQIDWEKGRIKLKHIELKKKNIFDFDDYPKEMKDVIVFCDILHHVYPRHIELVENAKKNARKIILCEPITVDPEKMQAHDWLAKTTIFLAKFMPNPMIKVLDFFLADNDGINPYEKRSTWKHNEESLTSLYKSMGFNKIYKLVDDYIAVWVNPESN